MNKQTIQFKLSKPDENGHWSDEVKRAMRWYVIRYLERINK